MPAPVIRSSIRTHLELVLSRVHARFMLLPELVWLDDERLQTQPHDSVFMQIIVKQHIPAVH